MRGMYLGAVGIARVTGMRLGIIKEMLFTGELPCSLLNGELKMSLRDLNLWLDAEVLPEELRKLGATMKMSPEEVDKILREGSDELRATNAV